jgi:glycosyltransferase involved in cell wall biosynthesis
MTAQRILICLHDFSRGGTERIALGLAASWAQAGRDVTILCGSIEGGLRDRVDMRVKVEELNPPVHRGFLSRLRLGRAMGKRVAALRPDIIFLPGNFHLLLAKALRKADARAIIVAKISNPPLPPAIPFAATFFRHFTRAVDGFAAMNCGLARELKLLLPGRNVVTLHDPVYIRPGAAKAQSDGSLNIVWIGRLAPQKDPQLALKTIQALDAAHLTMLGDGALRQEVQRQVGAKGLKDRVRLTGYVPETESYLAAADALLITSHYEGGPAVAVEALALGVPVVSTDCSFLLHDLLKLPQAGQIVASRSPDDLAAALAAVCGKPRAPDALRALAAPFDPKRCAQAYLDWFDRLAAHHG